tara:strand:+ start:2299 stop:3180 length:882 start_codon:yes stop_codon:yes gene_type:complete
MSSFAQMKSNRQSNIDKITNEVSKLQSPATPQGDDGFWKPEVDKSGNGHAIIRFLPAPEGEDVPFVRIWDHGFQGPGGWFIEKSLTTLGQPDPVSEYNTTLWNSGVESNKDLARKYKRRLSFISNIYVIKDPMNPQNEGKVFKYKYGKKIFDKLNDMMNPEFDDEAAVNPFDLWEGASFRLKMRNVEGFRNYDKSEFDSPGPLLEDDAKMEEVWNKEVSLKGLVDPKEFKSYDELKTRLYRVLALDGGSQAPTATVEQEMVSEPAPAQPQMATAEAGQDNDESLAFFKKLAED